MGTHFPLRRASPPGRASICCPYLLSLLSLTEACVPMYVRLPFGSRISSLPMQVHVDTRAGAAPTACWYVAASRCASQAPSANHTQRRLSHAPRMPRMLGVFSGSRNAEDVSAREHETSSLEIRTQCLCLTDLNRDRMTRVRGPRLHCGYETEFSRGRLTSSGKKQPLEDMNASTRLARIRAVYAIPVRCSTAALIPVRRRPIHPSVCHSRERCCSVHGGTGVATT
ncbi:hypothetical protein WOLCODRAFT_160877 [Wolfiporia cocos MD-104 SS10]|uniref:Secreted protein n=1 Tax=Wolfiporia cocos (strain MD-104) TaxID=742152 RepID=A0A2H3IWS9_WOLCO|nr:hypothetical protein WOLCODRAFT_160877 [Wolfiporia cocos MD-104 SS10]